MRNYIICFVIVCCSCRTTPITDEGPVKVYIRENKVYEIKAEDLFSKIRYIGLDYIESHPIGNIKKTYLHNDTLFISDGRTIFQYDLNGHYLQSLNRRGRGPEEYYNIMDFTVDDKYLYIVDQNKKILLYTTNNEFVQTSRLDFFPASLWPFGEYEFLLTSAYQDDVDKFHIYDNRTLQRVSSFCPINKAEMNYRHIINQKNFYMIGDRLLFHEPMNNTVYAIDSTMEISPVYEFSLCGKNPPSAFWTQKFTSIMDINNQITKEKYCIGIPIYAESPENILLTYRDADKYLMCIYSKENETATQFESIRFSELMPPISIGDLSWNSYGKTNFTDAIPCTSIFDENDSIYDPALAPVLKNNGNPVIGIIELK